MPSVASWRHLALTEVVAAAASAAGILLAAAQIVRRPSGLDVVAPLVIFSLAFAATGAGRLVSSDRTATIRQLRLAVLGGAIAGWSFLLLDGSEAASAAMLGTLAVAAGTAAAGLIEVAADRPLLTLRGWKIAFWVVLPSLLLGASAIGAFAADASPRAIELFGWSVAVLASGMSHVIPVASSVSVTARVAASGVVGIGIFLALASTGDYLNGIVAGLCAALLVDPVVRAWRGGGRDLSDHPVPLSEMGGFLVGTWAAIGAIGAGLITLAVLRS